MLYTLDDIKDLVIYQMIIKFIVIKIVLICMLLLINLINYCRRT
ncbi:hypothetical protein [Campylobacter phage CJLB-14]|nr:hypothetical protein [Campylobacter phage CJLB-14]